MTRTFRAHGDSVRATFRPVEVELLRVTRDELAAALERGDPDDPVVQRLFPPPVLGDPEVESELRQLFQADLLADRLEQLDQLVALLDRGEPHRGGVRIDLVEDEPLLFLGVLNDLRLAIGARIDVEAVDRAEVDEDHPAAYPMAVMDHLGWWQEQLLALIDPPAVRVHDLEELDAPASGDEPDRGEGPRRGGPPDGRTDDDPGGTG